MNKLLLLILCGLTSNVWAEDVVSYSGSTYQGCRNIGDTTTFLINQNDLTTVKPGFLYIPAGCKSVLPGIADRYRKVVDTNADTIPDTVVEMTQAEKDVVDAPALAEAARQQAFTQEINGTTGNDICHAELEEITTKVNTWLATRQAQLDAATTSTQVKASLRDQFYPAVAQAFLKVMKCTRSIQR